MVESFGPSKLNDPAPYFLLLLATLRRVVSIEERSPSLDGVNKEIESARYTGARSFIHLYMYMSILKRIRLFIGSQWRLFSNTEDE